MAKEDKQSLNYNKKIEVHVDKASVKQLNGSNGLFHEASTILVYTIMSTNLNFPGLTLMKLYAPK
jgi:hypothetical protein